MIVKIKLKYLIAALVILTGCFYVVYQRQENANFVEKNVEITKSIASNIENLDYEINNALRSATMLVVEKLKNKKITRNELIQISNKINVSTISIFDKNGYFYLTSGDAMNPDNKLYYFYKQMSVLSKELVQKQETVSTINACISAKKNQDSLFIMPIHLTLPRNIPNKVSVVYDSKLEKFIDISYNGKDVQKIIDQSFNLHDNIVYLGLLDNHGNVIAKKGNNSNLTPKEFNKYHERPLIEKNNNLITIYLNFGGEKDVKEVSTNEETIYFYTLVIAFKK